jgi:hypothetical protein
LFEKDNIFHLGAVAGAAKRSCKWTPRGGQGQRYKTFFFVTDSKVKKALEFVPGNPLQNI